MSKTFVIGDTHFNHINIIGYEMRPFIDINQMNNTMIINWNNNVGKRDHVIINGDFAFFNCAEIIQHLQGYKTLILGNHERGKSLTHWQCCGFYDVCKYPILYKNKYIISHEPIEEAIIKNSKFKNVCAHKHSLGINDFYHYFTSVELHNYSPVNMLDIDEYFNNVVDK